MRGQFTQKQYQTEINKLSKHAEKLGKTIGYGTNAYKNAMEGLTRLRVAMYEEFPQTQSAQSE